MKSVPSLLYVPIGKAVANEHKLDRRLISFLGERSLNLARLEMKLK